MGDDIQALLEKIQREGIDAAGVKAAEIEKEARQQAGRIIEQAKEQAASLLAQAQAQVRKEDMSSRACLAQAGRDLLLTLRSQIEKMLWQVCAGGIAQALDPEHTARLVADLITSTAAGKEQVVVSLPERDFERVRGCLLGLLANSVKKGIVLKAQTDIKAGFRISFDEGRSQFDFSDAALADYLAHSAKPQLERILRDALPEKRA